jgi:hypothetical protein
MQFLGDNLFCPLLCEHSVEVVYIFLSLVHKKHKLNMNSKEPLI